MVEFNDATIWSDVSSVLKRKKNETPITNCIWTQPFLLENESLNEATVALQRLIGWKTYDLLMLKPLPCTINSKCFHYDDLSKYFKTLEITLNEALQYQTVRMIYDFLTSALNEKSYSKRNQFHGKL